MKELDDYRIELLAKTIEYMAGVKKYTSSMIFKTYYMEEYVFHDSGSEGSVVKKPEIFTQCIQELLQKDTGKKKRNILH